jgi:ribosomal protein S18 acetylase RimI-like enzyme/precorrin-6B methylase 2
MTVEGAPPNSPEPVHALPQGVTEDKLRDHIADLVRDHHRLLADEVRNRAFHRALSRVVTPQSTVLDIGSGTGVWAISAALLGARRVVAIENDELLTGIIESLAREAGVGNRVEAICGRSDLVQLPKEFDVVVSETIGYDGFDEQIVPIMADARRRFLRDGGRIIPETVGLFAAPVQYSQPSLPRGLPFEFGGFRDLSLDVPRRLEPRARIRPMAPAQTLLDVDLYDPPGPSVLESLRAVFRVADASKVNGIAVWVESRLTKGIRISTRRTTSWTPVLYGLRSNVKGEATIMFDLSLQSRAIWKTEIEGVDGATDRSVHSTASGLRTVLSALRARPFVSPAGAAIVRALAPAPPLRTDPIPAASISFRPVVEPDQPFLFALYASTRAAELERVPWPAEQKHAFLVHQFGAQQKSYFGDYPGAEYLIVRAGERDAGRLYVRRTPEEIHVIDILLAPEFRGRGIGTVVLGGLLREAESGGRSVTIHVERDNPALRLYRRLGFVQGDSKNELYHFMRWKAAS